MNDHEKNIALRELSADEALNEYFPLRQEQDCGITRRIFVIGFVRGWDCQQVKIDALTARVAELEGVAK